MTDEDYGKINLAEYFVKKTDLVKATAIQDGLMSATDKIKLDNLQNIEANINWNDITNKPNSFTPSTHTHQKSDITDFNHSHGDIDENGVINSGNNGDILILGVGNRITSSASINANKVQDSPAYESIGVNQNSNQSTINNAINNALQSAQDYLDDLENEINDLNTNNIALDNTSDLSNLYTIDNVTTQSDLNLKFADLIRNSGGSGNSNNNIDWSNIINKPSFGTGANDFATGNHTHYSSAITTVSWGTGLTPQQRNIISSALNIANGDSLDTVLKESFWNIVNTLQNKANSTHTHTISNITDFPTIPLKTSDLTNDGANGTNIFVSDNDSRLSDARTPIAHTHDDRYYTENEVDTALNSKADSVHTHTTSNITDMETVELLVTYTDGTSETLTLYKEK